MESVPLRSFQFPPHNGGNATEIPWEGEDLRPPRAESSVVGRHDYNLDGPGIFLPLSAQEAASLPKLNFKPPALKVWYLVLIQIWFIACLSGVGVLVFFGRTQSTVLHLRLQYSYALWLYAPGIIAFLTTMLWRGTLQSYNRIIPYSHMAKPLVDEALGASLNEPLNGIPGGNVNPGLIFSLFQSGDYLSCAVNISPLVTWLLIPVKSGLIQLVEDGAGWGVRISVGFGAIAMITYFWLFLVTFSITIFFNRNHTGLKWSPCTLAAQVSLIQGSNILDEFVNIPTDSLNDAVRSWPKKGLRLHLGYWKKENSNLVIHGVRFLQASDTRTTSDLDPERGTRNFDTRAPYITLQKLPTNISSRPVQGTTPSDPRPHVDRVWNSFLSDAYLVIVTILGASALIAATVAWAKGSRHSSSSFAPDNQIVHPENGRHDSQTGSADPEGTIRVFLRGIVFTVLPSLLFGLFNNSFLAADIYQRTMTPIANMANPLEEDERARFYPGEAKIKGAMAKDSMLLDYISLDIISCVAAAVGNGDYKIVWGLLLATVCNSVYIVAGRIFAFVETPSPAGGVYYVVTIQERNFFAAFGIMIVYIISLWILRPHGVVRTSRRLFTLMDLASLVHQSHILQCPEFWLQSSSDTEDHLRAQVTLANRVYTYGIYKGYDQNEHVGIAPHSIPRAWDRSAGASLPNFYYSVELARDMLRYGLDGDDALKYAQDLLEIGPRTEDGCVRVRSNQYRSWRKGYRRPRGPRGNTQSHEGETSTTSSYQLPRTDARSGSYQRISLIEPPMMGAETGGTAARDRDEVESP